MSFFKKEIKEENSSPIETQNTNQEITEEPQVNLVKIPILKHFCMTIGNLPTSYFESMTYLEMVMWLCNYLEKTVIPTVNNNAEAVKELQDLYVKLNSYVTDYFNNLNVQDEINNKLEEMSKNGELETILNNTLFNNYEERIDYLEGNNTIFIGDSYGVVENSWIDKVATRMGLIIGTNAYKIAQSGYGFAKENQQFLTLLQNEESNIPNKNDIKNIIVCGGLNDTNATSQNAINTAITYFCNYVNQTYPNAQIYIGCIGWHENPDRSASHSGLREKVTTMVLPAYQFSSRNKNTHYLNGVEYIMHYYGFYGVDASHPNDIAQTYLANGIYQSYSTGISYFNASEINLTMESGITLSTLILQNKLITKFGGNLNISKITQTSAIGNVFCVFQDNIQNYIRYVNNKSYFKVYLNIKWDDETWTSTVGTVEPNSQGLLQITFLKGRSNLITGISFNGNQLVNDLLYF